MTTLAFIVLAMVNITLAVMCVVGVLEWGKEYPRRNTNPLSFLVIAYLAMTFWLALT